MDEATERRGLAEQLRSLALRYERCETIATPNRRTSSALRRAAELLDSDPPAATPDYCYDEQAWDCTFPWSDWDELVNPDSLPLGEVMEVGCLAKLPSRWAAGVVVTRDEAGDPDECEIQWFETEEAARAAALDYIEGSPK